MYNETVFPYHFFPERNHQKNPVSTVLIYASAIRGSHSSLIGDAKVYWATFSTQISSIEFTPVLKAMQMRELIDN